jgi:hypothetical protein
MMLHKWVGEGQSDQGTWGGPLGRHPHQVEWLGFERHRTTIKLNLPNHSKTCVVRDSSMSITMNQTVNHSTNVLTSAAVPFVNSTGSHTKSSSAGTNKKEKIIVKC